MEEKQQHAGQNQTPRFESDTQKLVHQHLADPNHQITDEDLQAVRVGMSPGADAPTQQAVKDSDEHIADTKKDNEGDIIPGAQKSTPWDVLGP